MTRAPLFLLLALLMPLSARAVTVDGHTYPDAWFACGDDSECVTFYGCADMGINKNYVDAYRDILTGCDSSAIHDPNAKAGCVNSICTITSTPPAAAPPMDEPEPADSPSAE